MELRLINAAVIFDDQSNAFYIALLDAKSAFDVVVLKILMRKAYLLDIDLSTWLIIDELHRNTRSVVKSNNQISREFYSSQGVNQGRLLSADLYKLYLEDMLNTLSLSKIGCTIGSINVNAVACADDVALISDNPDDLQILLKTAVLYSQKHNYTLQPQKSVIIPVSEKLAKSNKQTHTFRLNEEEMPNVEQSSHLGIIRSTSRLKTENETIDQNITKARRASYSLMSADLNGDNGLDPVTSISILKTYILPILTYSLEVLQLEVLIYINWNMQFQKSVLKRILSLPKNAPDPVLYIISGILPIEAQIDIKCLTLFNNIPRQPEDAIENLLSKRQLNIKENNSASWFITIKKKLYKYNLPNPLSLLDSPLKKKEWKNTVEKAVEKHWKTLILENCIMYIILSTICTAMYFNQIKFII